MVADSVNISGQSNNVQFKVESGRGDVSKLFQETNVGFQGTLIPTHAFQMSRNVLSQISTSDIYVSKHSFTTKVLIFSVLPGA